MELDSAKFPSEGQDRTEELVFTVPKGVADAKWNWELDEFLTIATADQAMMVVEAYHGVPENIQLSDYDPAGIKDSDFYSLGYLVSSDNSSPSDKYPTIQGIRIVRGIPYLIMCGENSDGTAGLVIASSRLTVGMVKALIKAYYDNTEMHINPMY